MQTEWQQNTIKTSSGVVLSYTRTGDAKKPIVLAHGITDNGLCWAQFAKDLADQYDFIMYDAYGHGQSDRVDPKKRFDMAEDLHDLINALALKKPAVIGHSMGAATAAAFAARYPDMLSALVLEDPPWSDQALDEETLASTMQEWKKRNLAAKKLKIKDLIKKKKKEAPNWEEAILPAWAEAKHQLDPAVFDQYPLDRTSWRDQARKITAPTLIVTGDQTLGAIVSLKLGLAAEEILPDGEFGHISGAGHCVRYEQYQPYLKMVSLFLKQNLTG